MMRSVSSCLSFQHTAARRRLLDLNLESSLVVVSTHSRPKAAACPSLEDNPVLSCFNTQPPEGGCAPPPPEKTPKRLFQHTAARRRLRRIQKNTARRCRFNTQPPEGGCAVTGEQADIIIGFNTQPPEGGCARPDSCCCWSTCFNTQPPEGGCLKRASSPTSRSTFQHTAA